jgi:hypothetical protein
MGSIVLGCVVRSCIPSVSGVHRGTVTEVVMVRGVVHVRVGGQLHRAAELEVIRGPVRATA